MATATNASVYIEQDQALVDYCQLTDSGDHQHYTFADPVISANETTPVDIRPNGVVSGLKMISQAASGSDDSLDVAAFTAYSKGVLQSVAAASDLTITRPLSDVAKVNSITMDSSGALVVIAGSDGADTSFSETRGAAGGPPEIPVDSVEIGQVRVTSATAAPITSSEIYQVGQYCERATLPVETNTIGLGIAADLPAKTNAYVKFGSALPLIHTGGVAKRIYARYYVPVFAEIPRIKDFQPAETSHSISTTTYYGGEIGSRSSSLGQGQFTALLDDGISDAIVAGKNKTLTVKFFPDRNKLGYILTQGKLGLQRSYPDSDQIQATVTVSAEVASAEFSG